MLTSNLHIYIKSYFIFTIILQFALCDDSTTCESNCNSHGGGHNGGGNPPTPTLPCDYQEFSTTSFMNNGDFETPKTNRDWLYYNPGNLSGWVSEQSEIGRGAFYNPNWGNTQVIELDGDRKNLNYSQIFVLTENNKYKFEFQVAARANKALNTSGFYVQLNQKTIISQIPPPDYKIYTFSYEFEALEESNMISIIGTGIPDSFGTTVDNVKLVEVLSSTNAKIVSGVCTCNEGYLNISGSCATCQSEEQNCNECELDGTDQIKCTKCSYGFEVVNGKCAQCLETIIGCLKCASLNSCAVCDEDEKFNLQGGNCLCNNGFFLDTWNKKCSPCNEIDPFCLSCTHITNFECAICKEGFFLDNGSCIPCSSIHYACSECSLGSICSSCNESPNWILKDGSCVCPSPAYYENYTQSECLPCSNLNNECLECSSEFNSTLDDYEHTNLYECEICLEEYFAKNESCLLCSISIPGCETCSIDGLTCLTCHTTEFWELNNEVCLCMFGYYQDNDECQECTSVENECLDCSFTNNTFSCIVCEWGLIPINGSCFPCSTLLHGCLNCSMDGSECFDCDESTFFFFENLNDLICTECSLEGCTNCSSLSICEECNESSSYFINPSTSICWFCSLPNCLTCSDYDTCSECNETNSYFLNTIQKCEICQQIGCLVCSSLSECSLCDRVSNFLLNHITNKCYKCSLEGCIMCINDNECEKCGTGYDPQPNNLSQCNPRTDCGQNSSAILRVDYQDNECEIAEDMQHVATTVGVMGYVTMVASLASAKIVGLELFGVFQLAYLNLADQPSVNLFLSPLLNWRYMNGFNLKPKNDSNKEKVESTKRNLQQTASSLDPWNQEKISVESNAVPVNVSAIGYTHSFIDNMNIMLLILLAETIVSIILVVLTSVFPILGRFSYFLIKEVFLTIFIFNCFNISFSAGLHFRYANPDNTSNYTISTIAAIVALLCSLLAIIGLLMFNPHEFGEYRNKFKKGILTEMYIAIAIIYRMILGFYMALANDQLYGNLLILAICLSFFMYSIINLPFTDAYQNYRSIICHGTQLAILVIANFYSVMKAHEPIEVSARIFSPAKIQIFLILLCLVVSMICVIYEMYLLINKCFVEKREQVNPLRKESEDKSTDYINTTEANETLR